MFFEKRGQALKWRDLGEQDRRKKRSETEEREANIKAGKSKEKGKDDLGPVMVSSIRCLDVHI